MSWSIHHVLVPAFETRKTAAFLRDVFDLEPLEVADTDKLNPMKPEDFLLFVDDAGRELHVAKPAPNFSVRNADAPVNPTSGHIAFEVDNLDEVQRRLRSLGATFSEPRLLGPPGVLRLYVYDPYMNVYEVNQRVSS